MPVLTVDVVAEVVASFQGEAREAYAQARAKGYALEHVYEANRHLEFIDLCTWLLDLLRACAAGEDRDAALARYGLKWEDPKAGGVR